MDLYYAILFHLLQCRKFPSKMHLKLASFRSANCMLAVKLLGILQYNEVLIVELSL